MGRYKIKEDIQMVYVLLPKQVYLGLLKLTCFSGLNFTHVTFCHYLYFVNCKNWAKIFLSENSLKELKI